MDGMDGMDGMDALSLKDAALQYAARGWAVFPLKPGTKLPATRDGFKSATVDCERIRAWWGADPSYNIGIATGLASGLVVVDFDKKSGGLETLDALTAQGLLPVTQCVATGGGGCHLYYAHPGVEVRNKAGLHPGLDVRGDGGYVVAAPSKVGDGLYHGYAWNKPLVALPDWLVDACRPAAPHSRPNHGPARGRTGRPQQAHPPFHRPGGPSPAPGIKSSTRPP